ncbi:Fe-S cluster assembly protein SufD [Aliiroseovarius halocynthiae]|uniref:Fe-S cluster assembly protein SufD n=1 Tax=Aliiroseovarius halocynthiae TaxID=985055 RepID=A0A545SVW1_9RHOB|nr:Fe-S cluster assembly protein SufD [Aliiroseovarius halocynthiae]TQV69106.1 Fe-S cluster assembly protein SufD [Aliiroseovarius halocynthiae]SMR71863.1 Fe-S cluster assembly protein SufD [Aliiroseovarius halocynthiae]
MSTAVKAQAALISADARPASGAWAADARADAASRLAAMGLPTRRDEYWKWTRPDSLISAEPASADVFDNQGETLVFHDIDRLKLVFVDGVFDADASDALDGEGLEIERLSMAATKDIHWAKDLYGVLETAGQTPVQRPLAVYNSAMATDGVVIRVTKTPTRPVSLIYRHEDPVSDVILHHVIRVEEGASLTLLENGAAAARFNQVTEVDVAKGAQFHHVRAQGRDHDRQAVTHIFARVDAESVFKSFTMTVNGKLTRNECVIDIIGDEAVAHIAGAALGDGAESEFHHDDTVFITHDAVACESRQVFKKVLKNGAKGVFQGKILVKPDAQKTDGYQKSQSLLLDDDASFQAKPELEIYADDVICSHGSTTGAIDEEALFYLRSRGVPTPIATDLLVLAFLADAIEEIEDEDIAAEITGRLDAWLTRRRG